MIHNINRWYYYKDISIEFDKFILTISESILSTGENRSPEWYYLNPLGFFIAEQMHNEDNIDGNPENNNDNYFIGIAIEYFKNDNLTIKGSIMIDDFQIDSEDRPSYQDVFGLSIGLEYSKNNTYISANYHYASPWLYTNNGLFTNYASHDLPIGLRLPNSYFIELELKHKFEYSSIQAIIIAGERGEQNLDTKWYSGNNDSESNYIEYFDFTQSIPLELFLKYSFNKNNNFIPNIILTHNWMASDINNFILEWEFYLIGFN